MGFIDRLYTELTSALTSFPLQLLKVFLILFLKQKLHIIITIPVAVDIVIMIGKMVEVTIIEVLIGSFVPLQVESLNSVKYSEL